MLLSISSNHSKVPLASPWKGWFDNLAVQRAFETLTLDLTMRFLSFYLFRFLSSFPSQEKDN